MSETENGTSNPTGEFPVEMPQSNSFDLNKFLEQRNDLKNQVSAMFESLETKPKFNRKDTMKVLFKLSQMVSHLDSLTEVVIRDLMVVDQRFSQMEQQIFAVANNHTVLKTALEEKSIVSIDELKKAWTDKVKPDLEKKIAAAKSEIESENNNSHSGLVDAEGKPL